MLNYFLRLRRKKGFTLVELIIVVAILAVLMASVVALSGPIRKMVSRTAASSDAIAANSTMANYIENRLAFAANIEILCAYDATDASAIGINDAFTNMKSKLDVDADGVVDDTLDKAGVLIFRYVEDTEYAEESHYEMYDVSIRDTDHPNYVCSSYYNAAIASSGGVNSLRSDAAVFADCFYDYSRNLFIAPTEYTTNSVRNNVYMTVEVVPYNFDSDMLVYGSDGKIDTTVNQYISRSTIPDYYMYKVNRAANPALYPDETCTLGAIDQHRLGTKETATFELQNIMTPTDADPVADITTRFKVSTPAPGAVATGGSDILIFYYVPHY